MNNLIKTKEAEIKALKKEFREHLSYIEIVDSTQDCTKAIAMTSSLCVAQIFGKRHDNVMAKIRQVIEDTSEEFRVLNFKEAEYDVITPHNGAIQKQPCYLMTKDGFTMVVMSFTGKKAAAFKEAYIEEFNRRGKEIQRLRMERERMKTTRRSLTDTIRDSMNNVKGYTYSNYTKLTFQKAFDISIDKFKVENNIPKDENVRNYLNEEQMKRLEFVENKMKSMIDSFKLFGVEENELYKKIKEIDL